MRGEELGSSSWEGAVLLLRWRRPQQVSVQDGRRQGDPHQYGRRMSQRFTVQGFSAGPILKMAAPGIQSSQYGPFRAHLSQNGCSYPRQLDTHPGDRKPTSTRSR